MSERELVEQLSELQARHDELILDLPAVCLAAIVRDLPAVCLAAIEGAVAGICAEHAVVNGDGERLSEEQVWDFASTQFLAELIDWLGDLPVASASRKGFGDGQPDGD